MQDNLYHLALIERGPFGVIIINIIPNSDEFGKITYINRQFSRLLGSSRNEIKDKFIWELQPKPSQASLREKLLKMAVQNKWQRIHTMPFQHTDGSQVYFKSYFKFKA